MESYALQTPTLAAPAVEPDDLTPSTLDMPAFLMNVPFSLSTEAPNNPWMEELSVEERSIDRRRAIVQFPQLYRHIASEALVYLLPAPGRRRLPDLCYTANLRLPL